MRNIGQWITNFLYALLLVSLSSLAVDARGGKAITLYTVDNNAAASDVYALELSSSELNEIISKYSKARKLNFDSGYLQHLEAKDTVFKLNTDSDIMTCECKAKPKPTTTTPKPTTTTRKPTTTTPKPPAPKIVTTRPPATYLPPAPTPPAPKPPGPTPPAPKPPAPTPLIIKKQDTTRISTRGPSYLPIRRIETTPGEKYTYIPRTYTYGTVPTYTNNYRWSFGTPGTYTYTTRQYTLGSTTTTPRYVRKDLGSNSLNLIGEY